MKRVTPRTPNPYRTLYKQYAETQFTLEEVLKEFQHCTIYGFLDNTSLYIVDGSKILLLFDSIGYDDDDCVPTLYEAYPQFGEDFDEIANCYLEDGFKPTKLN